MLVVKRLAKTIAKIAVLLLERARECVALSLENESLAAGTERMPSVDVKVCGGLLAYVEYNHT